jgi:ABC-type lipoprotein release transport system permease subunit
MVLGFELHRSLGFNVGDDVKLMGQTFKVIRCHESRGSRDDITVWINLADAQKLLDKPGRINAILALQCNCPNSDLASIRKQVAEILPQTQVIERKSKALARAEARAEIRSQGVKALDDERRHRLRLRDERNTFASVLVPIVLIACIIWIGITTFSNVRDRRTEIGILRVFGLRSAHITLLFLARAAIMGIVGGPIGCIVGSAAGAKLGMLLDSSEASAPQFVDAKVMLMSVVMACMLALIASWIPAVMAAQQDPADILREE